MRLLSRFLATVPLLTLCAFAIRPVAAQNGEWIVEYRDGDFTGSSPYHPQDFLQNFYTYYGTGVGYAKGDSDFVTTSPKRKEAKASIKFKAYAIWYVENADMYDAENLPKPPKAVFVEETVFGEALALKYAYNSNGNSILYQYVSSGGASFNLPFGTSTNVDNGWVGKIHQGTRRRVIGNSGGSSEALIGDFDISGNITFSIRASTYPVPPTYYFQGYASAAYGVTATNKGVILSSDIEPSYYKGELRGDLPDVAPPDARRQLHRRNEDGSMTVDSVVSERWSHSESRTKLQATAEMTANVYGIGITMPTSSQPQPTWESSGQINGGLYSTPPLELPYYRLFHQSDVNKDSLPGSTGIKFKVTDNTIPKDFEANYSINWHQPWENGHRIKPDEPAPDNMVSRGWDAPRGNGLGKDIHVHMQNPEIGLMEWYGQNGGGLVGSLGGPAGAGATAVYVARGGLSIPTGFVWGLVAEAALLVLDYQTNQGVAPRLPDVTMIGGEAELREAVSIQRRLNRGITGGIMAPYMQRITPKQYADDIETEEDFRAFYRGNSGIISVDPSRHNTNWKVFLVGDAYDLHGYVGDKNITVIDPRTEFPVLQFTVGGGAR